MQARAGFEGGGPSRVDAFEIHLLENHRLVFCWCSQAAQSSIS